MPVPTDGYAPVTARVLVDVSITEFDSRVFRFDATVDFRMGGTNSGTDDMLKAVAATVIEQARNSLDPTVEYTTEATITYSGDCTEDALPASGGV